MENCVCFELTTDLSVHINRELHSHDFTKEEREFLAHGLETKTVSVEMLNILNKKLGSQVSFQELLRGSKLLFHRPSARVEKNVWSLDYLYLLLCSF